MSAWRLFILSFLSNKYLYMFIPKHGFLEEAFLHCLGRSFNQRDVGHTLICYSWEKADIRATIQVQRFQLRHEAFCLTRFSDWGGVEETRPEDSSVGPVIVLPLTRKPAGEEGRGFWDGGQAHLLWPGLDHTWWGGWTMSCQRALWGP